MKMLTKYAPIVLAVICWSLSFVWVKDAYIDFTPMGLVVVRLLGASTILFIIGLLTKKLQAIKHGDIFLFLALSFFEPFLYFLGESFGMMQVSSTLGAVIISTIPLFTPLVSYLLIRERVTFTNIIGILLSLLGVLTIVITKDGGFSAPISGVLLMFLAVFAAVFYPVILKKVAHRYSGLSIVAYQSIIGFIYFLPIFLRYDYQKFIHTNFSTKSLISAAELTIFASILAFLLFTHSIKKIGVTNTNVFANLIPVLTAVFAYFMLDESLGAQKIIGILIVILGLFVCQIKLKKKKNDV